MQTEGDRRHHVTRTEQWLTSEGLHRHLLAEVSSKQGVCPARRRTIQAITNTFPTMENLMRYKIKESNICPLGDCREVETLCHLQCECRETKKTRIAVHHSIWKTVLEQVEMQTEATDFDILHEKTLARVGQTFAHKTRQNRKGGVNPFGKLIEKTRRHQGHQRKRIRSPAETRRDILTRVIHRQRPDGYFINWKNKELFILEFTRTFDSQLGNLTQADARKIARYHNLQRVMQNCLPQWVVKTLPFTVGVRGSLHRVWRQNLTLLGIPRKHHDHILKTVIQSTLLGMDKMFQARLQHSRMTPSKLSAPQKALPPPPSPMPSQGQEREKDVITGSRPIDETQLRRALDRRRTKAPQANQHAASEGDINLEGVTDQSGRRRREEARQQAQPDGKKSERGHKGDRASDQERKKERARDRDRQSEKEKDQEREQQRASERDPTSVRAKDKERKNEGNQKRTRERASESDCRRESERDHKTARERGSERHRKRERERDQERVRERRHKTEKERETERKQKSTREPERERTKEPNQAQPKLDSDRKSRKRRRQGSDEDERHRPKSRFRLGPEQAEQTHLLTSASGKEPLRELQA